MAFVKGRTDKEAQENGKWFEYEGGEFLIASISNTKMIEIMQAAKEQDDKEQDPSELAKRLAEGVLRDWKEIYDEDWNPIPYSVEAAVEELVENLGFLTFVLTTSQNSEGFKRQLKERKIEKVKKP